MSKLLKENVPAALAGTGRSFLSLPGMINEQAAAKIYFYDILGAEFEAVEYAVSGSGSPTIRGSLHYVNTWARSHWRPCRKSRRRSRPAIALERGGVRLGDGWGESRTKPVPGGQIRLPLPEFMPLQIRI